MMFILTTDSKHNKQCRKYELFNPTRSTYHRLVSCTGISSIYMIVDAQAVAWSHVEDFVAEALTSLQKVLLGTTYLCLSVITCTWVTEWSCGNLLNNLAAMFIIYKQKPLLLSKNKRKLNIAQWLFRKIQLKKKWFLII